MKLTHEELCERARRWLSGTRRCDPVFSNCASCAEIPDAIGWSSVYQWAGSTVIECKTSESDFRADKNKRIGYKDDKNGHIHTMNWVTKKWAKEHGFEEVELPIMGDYRFYLCEPGIITVHMVEMHAPDHGLILKDGRKMTIVRAAPLRVNVDKDSEIRFLRFAIINGKKPYEKPVEETPKLFEAIAES